MAESICARVRPGRGVRSSGAWFGPHQRGRSSEKVWPVRGSRYAEDMAGIVRLPLRSGEGAELSWGTLLLVSQKLIDVPHRRHMIGTARRKVS